MQSADRIKEIDKAFEIMLLLASIIAATLIQFVSSAPYIEQAVPSYDQYLRFSLKMFLIPVIFMVLLWFPTQLSKGREPRHLLLRMWAWTYLLLMLGLYIFFTMAFGFVELALVLSLPAHAAIVLLVILVPAGVLVWFLQKEYERAIDWKPSGKTESIGYRALPILAAIVLAEITYVLSAYTL